MGQSNVENGSIWPMELEYRLTKADILRYAASTRLRACRILCHDQGQGLLILASLEFILIGLFYYSRGFRSVLLILAWSLAVLLSLAVIRSVWCCRRTCRVARELGVPFEVRLTISSTGITKKPNVDDPDLDRTFSWAEVSEVFRVDHLNVVHLRPAGGILLIPDRAFSDDRSRTRFLFEARGWCANGHSS